MGTPPYCKNVGLKRGRWTRQEDELLTKYIQDNGEGCWKSLPKNAGLSRCGKNCRLRWINYLRDDLKRGNIGMEEDEMIVKLHKAFGNRWSLIAACLPGRTDNEIKNHWKTRLSRQIHRCFTNKSGNTQTSIDIVNLVNHKKQRVGRVSRNIAKKYNKNRIFKNKTSPSISTKEKPTPPAAVENQINENVRFQNDDELISNWLRFQDNDELISNPLGFLDDDKLEWIPRGFQANDQLGSNLLGSLDDNVIELGFNDDELIDIECFFENEATISSEDLSLLDEEEIEKLSAEIDIDVGNVKNNKWNADDKNLNVNSSKTVGFCFDENESDMEFGFKGFDMCDDGDEMLVWQLELGRWQYLIKHKNSSVSSPKTIISCGGTSRK